MQKFITKNYKETQKLGEKFAKEILSYKKNKCAENSRSCKNCAAIVLCLYGDLGSGKTTFLQGFANCLGVKEKILSPTFVIYKKFLIFNKLSAIRKNNDRSFYAKRCFHYFYHVDAYRLKNEKDAKELGLEEILKNLENIVAIEWPEKIKKILPKTAVKINFKFISENKRAINIEI